MRREEHGEDISIKDAATGREFVGKRRHGAQFMKNGNRSNDYLQFAIRLFTAIKVGIGALAAFIGAVAIVFEFLVIPQLEKKMDEVAKKTTAPIIEKLEQDERLFQKHLIDVAERSALYPTRDDLRRDLGEIKSTLEMIRGRQ